MAKRTRRPRLPRPPATPDVTAALKRQARLVAELDEDGPPRASPSRSPLALPSPSPLALPSPSPSQDAVGDAPAIDGSVRLAAWLEAAERRVADERAWSPRRASPAAATGFWEGHQVAWMKLVVVRLVFFGLLAADAFLQLAHAARYGAGGFNVPQLGWLPLGAPHRLAMIAIHAGLALAFALIAQGVAVRVLLPLATVAYAYAYLVSQLDSYQHHYLVGLLLIAWCFVPRAPEPHPPGAAAGAPLTVRSWALRLVLVQLAVVYLWAAVAKVDPLWTTGSTLRAQVAPGWVRDAIAYPGFDTVSVLVVLAELTLAATVWLRRAWWIALPIGVGLHLGIELVGLEIGLFSYLMLALYLLLVPDRAYHALDRATRRARRALRAIELPWLVGGGLAAAVAAVAFLAIPLPMLAPALAVVGVIAAVVVGLALRRGRRGRAGRELAALAVALALPVALAQVTDTIIDHHRYRAGDARRFGDQRTAREAYRAMLAIDPSSEYAHYHLGGLDAEAGALDAAVAHYHAAQRAEPLIARSFVAEARLVFARGELARAQALLRDALAADPADADALALENAWQSMAPAEGPDRAPAPPSPRPPAEAPPPEPRAPAPAEAPPSAGIDGGR